MLLDMQEEQNYNQRMALQMPVRRNPPKGFIGQQMSGHHKAEDLLFKIQETSIKLKAAKDKLDTLLMEVPSSMHNTDVAICQGQLAVLAERTKLLRLNSEYVDILFKLVEPAIKENVFSNDTTAQA